MVGGVSGTVPGVRLLRARQQLPADADRVQDQVLLAVDRAAEERGVLARALGGQRAADHLAHPSPRARTAASAAGVAAETTLLVTLPANELTGFRQTEPARVVLQVVPAGQEKRPPRQTDA